MALSRTGSKLFAKLNSYVRPQARPTQPGWDEAVQHRDSMMQANPVPQQAQPSTLDRVRQGVGAVRGAARGWLGQQKRLMDTPLTAWQGPVNAPPPEWQGPTQSPVDQLRSGVQSVRGGVREWLSQQGNAMYPPDLSAGMGPMPMPTPRVSSAGGPPPVQMPMVPGSGRGSTGSNQMPVSQPGPSSTAPANWGEWANEFGQNLSAMGQHKFVGPQNPMQPPVDLSGLQGAPTSLGVGLAGMMPGYGGMAAQGALAGYGKGYMMSKWMQDNPQSQMSQALPGQGQSVRALNAITDAPQPQNSLQAATIADNNPMMNRAVAGMSNGYYSPPSSVSQGREYGLTLPMDQAGMENRIANQNPMYEGMQGRFGGGSVIGQQAATIAAGDAGVAAGTHVKIPGSYGEMPTYIEKRQEPEVKYRSNKNGDQVSYVDNTDPVLRRQFNALRNFKANPERGANRKAAREATKARLSDSRFKMMVGKGMNPNSAKAKAMFPEQTGGGKLNPNNPMAKVFEPGAPDTVENRKARDEARTVNVDNSLTLQSIGVTPDMSPYDFALTARQAFTGDLSDQGYQDLFNHVKTYAADKGQKSPEWPRGYSDSWNELWSMPQDTPLPNIKEWVAREKAAMAREAAEASRNNSQALQYIGM